MELIIPPGHSSGESPDSPEQGAYAPIPNTTALLHEEGHNLQEAHNLHSTPRPLTGQKGMISHHPCHSPRDDCLEDCTWAGPCPGQTGRSHGYPWGNRSQEGPEVPFELYKGGIAHS